MKDVTRHRQGRTSTGRFWAKPWRVLHEGVGLARDYRTYRIVGYDVVSARRSRGGGARDVIKSKYFTTLQL